MEPGLSSRWQHASPRPSSPLRADDCSTETGATGGYLLWLQVFHKKGVDMKVIEHSAGSGRNQVDGVGIILDAGTQIVLGTPTASHVGATAIGVPRPPHNDGTPAEASVSVYCATGHMDDIPAHDLATRIGTRLWEPTVVTVGLHIDHATLEEVEALQANAQAVADLIAADVEQYRAEHPSEGAH